MRLAVSREWCCGSWIVCETLNSCKERNSTKGWEQTIKGICSFDKSKAKWTNVRKWIDSVVWTLKSRDSKPIKQVCIGTDRQMFIICLALPTHSCGDCPPANNSLYLSRRTSTMRKIQNVGWLNAFLQMLLPVLTADCRHWGRPQGVAKREVSVLSSRHSVAIALYLACPDNVIQQQRTAQRRARQPWGKLKKQSNQCNKSGNCLFAEGNKKSKKVVANVLSLGIICYLCKQKKCSLVRSKLRRTKASSSFLIR